VNRSGPRFPLIALCAGVALALLACKADTPEGAKRCGSDEDCRVGFSCRADDSGEQRCASDSSGTTPDDERDGGTSGAPSSTGGEPARDGGAGSNAGAGGASSAGSDGGAPPAEVAPRTAPGFSSGGGRRSGPGLALYDDGFERSGRDCSEDGVLCVTGGFVP
jgi:hypothetical protein